MGSTGVEHSAQKTGFTRGACHNMREEDRVGQPRESRDTVSPASADGQPSRDRLDRGFTLIRIAHLFDPRKWWR